MWKYSLRLSHRPIRTGACIALILSTIGLFFVECDMGTIIGCVLAGLGVLGFLILMFKPIGKEIPPLEVAIKQSKEVWGMWFTGDQILQLGLIEGRSSIKKIMLMKPGSKAFEKSAELTHVSKDDIKKEILMLTKRAKHKGIEIRWYFEHQGIGLTLYEPEDNNAWCYWQELVDQRPRDARTSYTTSRKKEEGLYNSKLEQFNRIWFDDNLSEYPKKEEYESFDMSEYENKRKRKWWKIRKNR